MPAVAGKASASRKPTNCWFYSHKSTYWLMSSTSVPHCTRSYTLHWRIKSFAVSLSAQPSCQLTGEMPTLLAGCLLSVSRLRATSQLGISPQAHLHREALQTCRRPPPSLSPHPTGAGPVSHSPTIPFSFHHARWTWREHTTAHTRSFAHVQAHLHECLQKLI